MNVVNAKNSSHPDAQVAVWVAERLHAMGLQWGAHGGICCTMSDERFWIKQNHLKCLVRRDYLEAFGPYPGLDKIIADIIQYAIKKAAKDAELHGVEYNVTGYLPT